MNIPTDTESQLTFLGIGGVHRDISVMLFRKLGLEKVEGVPIEAWWEKERRELIPPAMDGKTTDQRAATGNDENA